jgi:hypothetical protein
MSIGGIGAFALSALNLPGKIRGGDPAADVPDVMTLRESAKKDPASPAAQSNFPTAIYGGVSAASVIVLQSAPTSLQPDATEIETTKPSTEEVFLAEAHKNPLERLVEKLRKEALDAMGQSEDSLQTLPPQQRSDIEKQIAEFIQKKLREALGGDSQTAGSQTAGSQSAAGPPDASQQPDARQGLGALISQFA